MVQKITIFHLILLITATASISAQNQEDIKYNRSSLTMIYLTGQSFHEDRSNLDPEDAKIDNTPQAVKNLWDNYPFPDKYDEHLIPSSTINIVSTLDGKNLLEVMSGKKQKEDIKNLQPQVDQQLKAQRVAHQVVRKWFSSEDGKFWDMSTIQRRGFYNATEIEADIAKQDVRGMAKLADAGEELLKNSFVTVTDLHLFANKPLSDLYYAIAAELTDKANEIIRKARGKDMATQLAASIQSAPYLLTATGFAVAAAAIKDGFTVFSKTFLYKLKWNDEIQARFYQNWGNDAAFERMNFELEFIGVQYNKTKLNRGVFNKAPNRKPEVVIKQAVVRNIDEAFAQLQKDNEVFKPMVPIIGTDPIIAQVGLKESITAKSKFNVLQKTEDPITGKTRWQKVGVVKVDKIWDNRYYAGEEKFDDEGNRITVDDRAKGTTFKGGKNIVPGMMLKLIK